MSQGGGRRRSFWWLSAFKCHPLSGVKMNSSMYLRSDVTVLILSVIACVRMWVVSA